MAKDFYRCDNCNTVTEAFDLITIKGDKVPIGDGYTHLPDREACPHCKEEEYFTEVYPCSECEEYFEELYGGRCKACLEKHMDFGTVKGYGSDNPETVELNSILTMAFDRDEMEEILFRELKASGEADKAVKDLVENDLEYFAVWLEERDDFIEDYVACIEEVCCGYCGSPSGSPDPNVLCKECRETFGHAFLSEL